MAKFIMSVGDETLRVLITEAGKRNVRVQQLIRAVIVPEWVKNNLVTGAAQSAQREVEIQLTRPSLYDLRRGPAFESSMDRVKRRRANARATLDNLLSRQEY